MIQKSHVITSVKFFGALTLYASFLFWLYQSNQPDLLIVFLTISLIAPIVWLIHDRFKQQQIIDNLHQETLTAELNLLKSQINPHFFFNTLNNLYGLAIEKSDLTQEVIYKLSQMMRFTIYDGRKNSVSVEDEVNYLNNFIELNQIRHKNTLDITFIQQCENMEQRIPPLLFINLLENAFKHGIDTQTSGQYIEFTLATNQQTIAFELRNNFDPQVLESKKHQQRSGGLGIANLKRRLKLLYPSKHQYIERVEGCEFYTKVIIDLT